MLTILSSVGQTIRKLMSLSNRWRAAFSMSDLAYRVIIWEWKSTSGIVFFLGSNLMTSTSPKQRVVALSVLLCSWIYIAASAGACQRCLPQQAHCRPYWWWSEDVQALHWQAASLHWRELSKISVYHQRSKNIDTPYHIFVTRECVSNGSVQVDLVGTDRQLANALTNQLGRIRFFKLGQRLGAIKV